MTLTSVIDNLTSWANENICAGLELKFPPDDKKQSVYAGETAKPAAFPLFVPAKDRLPPGVCAPVPSLCVQLKQGSDKFPNKERILRCRFSLAAWNPGEHSINTFIPYKNADNNTISYKKISKEEAENLFEPYKRNMEGWRDVWNFADKAISALENTEFIAGCRLIKENGIDFGPFTEDGVIWDYYPYWFLWIDFDLQCGVVTKTPESYENLL